jgi:ligand-binding sensor protein
VDPKKLTLDADQIIILLIYIAGKAAVKNIFAYVSFIKDFSTPYVLTTTRMGFCLTSLEVALNLICEKKDAIAAIETDEGSLKDTEWQERFKIVKEASVRMTKSINSISNTDNSLELN